jgi:hypothetical protein
MEQNKVHSISDKKKPNFCSGATRWNRQKMAEKAINTAEHKNITNLKSKSL